MISPRFDRATARDGNVDTVRNRVTTERRRRTVARTAVLVLLSVLHLTIWCQTGAIADDGHVVATSHTSGTGHCHHHTPRHQPHDATLTAPRHDRVSAPVSEASDPPETVAPSSTDLRATSPRQVGRPPSTGRTVLITNCVSRT